jgi:hypothetical protein
MTWPLERLSNCGDSSTIPNHNMVEMTQSGPPVLELRNIRCPNFVNPADARSTIILPSSHGRKPNQILRQWHIRYKKVILFSQPYRFKCHIFRNECFGEIMPNNSSLETLSQLVNPSWLQTKHINVINIH